MIWYKAYLQDDAVISETALTVSESGRIVKSEWFELEAAKENLKYDNEKSLVDKLLFNSLDLPKIERAAAK